MTLNRRTLIRSGAIIGSGAALLAAPAVAQEKIVWRMVTTWPKNAPGVGINAQRFADEVGAMSGGRLTIQLYAAGELVPAYESLDAVQQGDAEIAHSAPFFWLGKSEALNYFGSIPLGLMASEIAAWIYFGGGMALWEEAMADFGIKPLFAGSSGVSAGGWYRNEINSLEDIKGLKLRMAGLGGEVMKRLGATPVLTPPSEVFQAMAAGTVDAAELIGPWNDLAFGLYKVASYYYLPGFHEVGPTAELLVNQAAFDQLPADLQAVVETAARASAMSYGADYRYHNVTALQPLVDERGVQLRRFPTEVEAAMGKASMEVLAELGERSALTRKIHGSYMAFLKAADRYSLWFDQPALAQRSAALATV
jgi:TRAP-type mannitol/chloroaromatic compound transport system substrate-binding protein